MEEVILKKRSNVSEEWWSRERKVVEVGQLKFVRGLE